MNLFKTFLQLGLHENLTSSERKKVEILNILALTYFCFKVFFLLVDLTQLIWLNIFGHSIELVVLPFVGFLQHKRKYLLARGLFISLPIFTIYLFAYVFEPDGLLEYLFLLVPPMGLVLFDKKKYTIGILIFCILSFLIPNFIFNFTPYINNWPGSKVILFIGIYMIVNYFKTLNQQNEAELMKQKEEIKKLYEYQNNFFINVAHEIRTPLTIIHGKTNAILKSSTDDNPTIHSQADALNQQVQKIKRMVDDIMDMSKIDNHNFTLKKEPIQINGLVSKIYHSFDVNFKQKNVAFELFDHTDSNIQIKGDAIYLERAICNLIINALKYSNKDDLVKIILLQENNQVKIEIKDTGIGIAESQIDAIFDRFYQVQNEINQAGGSGIGLAFCKEIIQLHEGQIQVRSVVNQGSTFSFTLPIDDKSRFEEDINNNTLTNVPESKKSKENLVRNKKILLVEDNFDMRLYIKEILPMYQIVEAGNGVDGLEVLAKKQIDLVISDFMMPKMNGFDFVNQMKEQGYSTPVILVTALNDEAIKLKMLRLGVDDYITKPFLEEELLARINNSLTNYTKWKDYTNSQPPDDSEKKEESEFMTELKEMIWENCSDSNFGLENICTHFSISKSTLQRKVKLHSGLSPKNIITEVKLQKANDFIKNNSDWNAKQILHEIGWSNVTYFHEKYKERFGRDLRD